jgi:GNAT superfamily N-acetyltransferase
MKFNTYFSFDEIKTLVENNENLKKTFRYFSSRDAICLENHVYHFILCDPDPVGYGHLDYESGKIWLGMCVFDSFVGKGYGKFILKNLIHNRNNNPLYLTVDKDNYKAINLYLNNGFKIYSYSEKIFYCSLK